jgi:hypothetical protein
VHVKKKFYDLYDNNNSYNSCEVVL